MPEQVHCKNCYFNTFRCFSSPIGVISTPKSVEIHQNGVKLTPLEIGPVLTPAGVNLTPEFLQCRGVWMPMWVGVKYSCNDSHRALSAVYFAKDAFGYIASK